MHEIHLDYLQASITYREDTCRELLHKEVPTTKFYKRGYQDELGVRRYFGNPKSEKALVVYSGVALHNRRVVGWDDRTTVNDILTKGGKITRIDWAITDYIDTHLITPKLISTIFGMGKITGSLADRGASYIAGRKVGAPPKLETFYIGDWQRRGNNGIFRAYDASLNELGLSDLITRLELEERKDNAHNSAKRYANGASMQSIIKSRLDIRHEQTDRVFEAEPIDISRGDQLKIDSEDEEMDRKWTWLMKQVAPALRKMVEYDRKHGKGDDRMMNFLYSAGIVQDNKKRGSE